MALTRDRATSYREGIEIEYPVAAVKIYAGSMVCLNAAGYAAPAADTVNFKFAGVALEQVDNSLGSPGDKIIRVRRPGVFEFKASNIAQSDVGKQMYVVNDETFDVANPGQGILCGVLAKFVSATRGWLDTGSGVKPTLAAASADALTVSDAGAFFPAATGTVPEQIQDLAKGPFFLTINTLAAWTKDGAAHAAVIPKVEFPFPVRIKRNYSGLTAAPSAGHTLSVLIGAVEIASIVDAAVQGENEALDIPLAKDTDLDLKLNETTGGAGAGLQCVLVYYKDDGE